MSDAQQTQIFHQIETTRLSQPPHRETRRARSSLDELAWPLRATGGYADPAYHYTSNFVDLDGRSPDRILDHQCGDRSYDTASGYDHAGTDFALWPFSWRLMDSNQIEVVAAAPGVLSCKTDGNYDRECGLGDADPNIVCVTHDDGSTTLYAHLQNDSTTDKEIGSAIETGEYLGRVGSSGVSTGPHLHFELRNALNEPVDPFRGPCGAEVSLWAEQPPYYDSAINKVATHDAPPDLKLDECSTPEDTHLSNVFQPRDTLYVAAYYRDQLRDQSSHFQVWTPGGKLWREKTLTPAADDPDALPHYAASYWYYSWTLPAAADFAMGDWSVEIEFEGQVYTHTFRVPEPASDALSLTAMITLLALVRRRASSRRDGGWRPGND